MTSKESWSLKNMGLIPLYNGIDVKTETLVWVWSNIGYKHRSDIMFWNAKYST